MLYNRETQKVKERKVRRWWLQLDCSRRSQSSYPTIEGLEGYMADTKRDRLRFVGAPVRSMDEAACPMQCTRGRGHMINVAHATIGEYWNRVSSSMRLGSCHLKQMCLV